MKHLKTYKIFESILSEKLYHGNRKGDFPPQIKRFAGAIFLTTNIDFAKNFASLDEKEEYPDASVFEVKLKSDIKLCNPMDSEVMKELNLVEVKNGAWRVVECEPIINQIKSKKYDGFYVIERGSKNVAIFDESSIEKFNKISVTI